MIIGVEYHQSCHYSTHNIQSHVNANIEKISYCIFQYIYNMHTLLLYVSISGKMHIIGYKICGKCFSHFSIKYFIYINLKVIFTN